MTDKEQQIARICCGNLHSKRICDAMSECVYTEAARKIMDLIQTEKSASIKDFGKKLKKAIEREKIADEKSCGKSAYKVGFYLALINLIDELVKEYDE